MDSTYKDPSTILYTLDSLSSELKLIESYISGNASLAPPDPVQTYTCGAIFTEHLDSFFKLLNRTAIAASSLINSVQIARVFLDFQLICNSSILELNGRHTFVQRYQGSRRVQQHSALLDESDGAGHRAAAE